MLDFNTDPLVEPAVLITIMTEAVLQDSIIQLLRKLKIQGYTVSQIQGRGYKRLLVRSRPTSPEPPEATTDSTTDPTSVDKGIDLHVEVKAIVSKEVANVLFYALKEQQRNFAIVAYRHEVDTLSEL